MSFWNNDHPLTPLADYIDEKYIPASGKTEFVETEVYRAITKLYHDYFNNGFGNNMSRPVEYIRRFYLEQATPEFRDAFNIVSECADDPSEIHPLLEKMLDDLVKEIVLYVQEREVFNRLTPIELEIADMPYREMKWDVIDWGEED